ncbi:MAG: hypothetical protein EXR99_09330, partial [Gemmataceae bacterium]|nr:hypothetical protein [Gemmataceae bacterium]
MPVQAHPPSPERNLLFAGLGLTLGLLTREKITRAFSEWLLNKTQPLANILVEQKAITQEQKSIIESAVELQIQVDGNEAHALASLKNAGE